eukprot:2727031-Rhodomonas_salina.2
MASADDHLGAYHEVLQPLMLSSVGVRGFSFHTPSLSSLLIDVQPANNPASYATWRIRSSICSIVAAAESSM